MTKMSGAQALLESLEHQYSPDMSSVQPTKLKATHEPAEEQAYACQPAVPELPT
jgi:hypothetical protein